MSIQHYLLIKTDQTPHQIAELLARELPFAESITSDEDLRQYDWEWKDIVTTHKALNFTVMDVSDYKREIAEEHYGFTPDVLVSFTITKDIEYFDEGERQMFQTIKWLLEHFPEENAVFLMFDGVKPALWRKQGKLLLSSNMRDEDNLRETDAENLDMPYEWARFDPDHF